MFALANVIFPAFYWPYVAQLFFPFAALGGLAAEAAFYRWWVDDDRIERLVVIVVLVNVASSLLGMGIASCLPTGYSPEFVHTAKGSWQAPEWKNYAYAAWVVAFLVSVIVEGMLLVVVRRFLHIRRPFVAATFANACSYTVLIALMFLSAFVQR